MKCMANVCKILWGLQQLGCWGNEAKQGHMHPAPFMVWGKQRLQNLHKTQGTTAPPTSFDELFLLGP